MIGARHKLPAAEPPTHDIVNRYPEPIAGGLGWWRGRVLTDRVLAATTAAAAFDQPARDTLAQDMAAYIRMFEPHEAREDTVVFPALRDVMSAVEFRDMAETFEDEEHRRFGEAGFQSVVDKVADIEKSLGIYDLSQFTPS
ncbi:hypothetical protein X192_02071 [Mycobacterium tuberculosis BTB11-210]|nr:hypothetical protein X192_02071 [Mycobacterium tuberculosis BTB11-210]